MTCWLQSQASKHTLSSILEARLQVKKGPLIQRTFHNTHSSSLLPNNPRKLMAPSKTACSFGQCLVSVMALDLEGYQYHTYLGLIQQQLTPKSWCLWIQILISHKTFFFLLRTGFSSVPTSHVQTLAKAWWFQHKSGQGPVAELQPRKHVLEHGHKHHKEVQFVLSTGTPDLPVSNTFYRCIKFTLDEWSVMRRLRPKIKQTMIKYYTYQRLT